MNKPNESKVPKSRLARFSRLTALATSVAGGMVAEGARQLAQGKRPKLSNMLLTPANARRVADQLAQLRGAAMKVGQLLSMDAGDLLPPELSDILARLRSDAKMMPRSQLEGVLKAQWGEGWQARLRHFSWTPMAAASIGQVHEAVSLEGQRLAIKIQYPGVRESIDSDIDNVASILKFTGLIPDTLDIQNLLQEAKKQLHEEADYQREADSLEAFTQALGEDARFDIPTVHRDLSTSRILAMRYVHGVAVEGLTDAPQETRDHIASSLFSLFFKELIQMRLVQTDPNFANYQYNAEQQKLVLLDFGATRRYSPELVGGYLAVMDAALAGNRAGLKAAAMRIGYFDEKTLPHHRELVLDLMELACVPLCTQGPFAFGQTDLASRIRDKGLALAEDRQFWHTPPVDCLFLHRKLGGLYLLAARLKANVDIQACIHASTSPTKPQAL